MKDKNKIIVFITIIALFLVGLFLLARPSVNKKEVTDVSENTSGSVNSDSPSIADALTTEEQLYDFGKISMKDGLVEHTFVVTNSSKKDIFVKKVYTSCMCTTAFIESITGEKGPFGMEGMGYLPPVNETIKIGESRNIRIIYDPNAHGPAGVGLIDRLVYLEDADRNELQLEIKANVTP